MVSPPSSLRVLTRLPKTTGTVIAILFRFNDLMRGARARAAMDASTTLSRLWCSDEDYVLCVDVKPPTGNSATHCSRRRRQFTTILDGLLSVPVVRGIADQLFSVEADSEFYGVLSLYDGICPGVRHLDIRFLR